MNKELVKTTLDVALKGKKISNFFMAREVGEVVKKLFEETRKDLVEQGYHIFIVRQDNRSTICDVKITNDKWNYKSYILCVIDVKRTRDWRDDYFFKDFEVTNFDIDDKLVKIDEERAKQEAKEDREHSEAIELFKFIVEKYPNDDEWKLKDRIDYLKSAFYSIYDEVKGVK